VSFFLSIYLQWYIDSECCDYQHTVCGSGYKYLQSTLTTSTWTEELQHSVSNLTHFTTGQTPCTDTYILSPSDNQSDHHVFLSWVLFLLSYPHLTRPDAHLTFQHGKGSPLHSGTQLLQPTIVTPGHQCFKTQPREPNWCTYQVNTCLLQHRFDHKPQIFVNEISSPHTYTYNRYSPMTLYPNLKMAYHGRNM